MLNNNTARAQQDPVPGGTPNLRTLLAQSDEQFIESAYLSLLKRRPDTEGFRYYLGRLHSGTRKLQILSEIVDSREAQLAGVIMPGLRRAITLHKRFSWFPMARPLLEAYVKKSREFGDDTARAAGLLATINGTPTQSAHKEQSAPIHASTSGVRPANEADHTAVVGGDLQSGLILLQDRSIGEIAWEPYVERVLVHRLITPLRNEPRQIPAAKLVVLVDCMDGNGTAASCDKTRASLSTLISASEYLVEVLWYFKDESIRRLADDADGGSNLRRTVSKLDVSSFIGDKDLVLVLRPGDEVRPQLPAALNIYRAFDACFTLIDLYFSDEGRIFPLLLHAVDPIHASYCDYFLGRYVANGRTLKKSLEQFPDAAPSAIGSRICSQLVSDGSTGWRHVPIPLVSVNTSNAELKRLRANLILERAHHDSTPRTDILECPPTTEIRQATTGRTASVSAIICTKDCGLLLRQLLYRLKSEALIRDIIVVSNNTTNPHALRTLVSASATDRTTILRYDGSFNFSRQCNLGAKYASGSELLFLNDDIAPVSDDWLERLHAWIGPSRIAGPLLIYPNESVQHAGMHLGHYGTAGHLMRYSRVPSEDYGFLLTAPRHVSCLTGAALLVSKTLFMALNGFDPLLATHLQDVDLSLRALYSGCELIFDPRSILIHMESISVRPTLELEKVRQLQKLERAHFVNRWASALHDDAWMNPLFDPMDESRTALRV